MSGFNHIRVEVKGDMLFLFFNRPRVKNAIAPATYLEIVQVLKSAEDNDDIRAVVLSGTGDYFTSGADISFSDTSEYKASMRDPPIAPVGQFMFALMRFPKLLVAAVNGPAVGIGVTLLTHCDFCYAATSATFWTPFVRVAVVPEFCSTVIFPRIFGPSLGNEMLLGARVLKVEEAQAAGLIAAVFPNDQLLAEVEKRMRAILDQPLARESLPLFKKMIKRPTEEELEAVLRSELVELGRRALDGDTGKAIHLLNEAKRAALKASSKL